MNAGKVVPTWHPVRLTSIPLSAMIPKFAGHAEASRVSRTLTGHRFDRSRRAEAGFIPRESGASTSSPMNWLPE
jgi:hypothetical protein